MLPMLRIFKGIISVIIKNGRGSNPKLTMKIVIAKLVKGTQVKPAVLKPNAVKYSNKAKDTRPIPVPIEDTVSKIYMLEPYTYVSQSDIYICMHFKSILQTFLPAHSTKNVATHEPISIIMATIIAVNLGGRFVPDFSNIVAV